MNILDIGIAKGEEEEKKKIIKNMILHGMDAEEIIKITECTREFFEEVQSDN